MTTLTRIVLNPGHRDVCRDLTDVDRLHRRVMSLLPNGLGPNPRHSTATLYRLDGERSGTPTLLIQTDGDISTVPLPEGYATATKTLNLATLSTHLTESRTVRYTLTANPSRRNGITGKRTGLRGTDALNAWWERHATLAGLTPHPDTTRIDPTGTIRGTKTGATDTPHSIRHDSVRISGCATITNPTHLTAALHAGIGPGKSHGLGLLTVVPVSN